MSQPVDQVYPTTFSKQPSSNSNSNSNSNGSFGPVFIVLAVVLVVSAIACVFGRLCNGKRHHGNKEKHRGKEEHHRGKAKPGGRGQELGPKEWESRQKPSFKDGDIEFGFDNKRIPSAKVASIGDPRGPKPPQNGGFKGQVRFSDNV